MTSSEGDRKRRNEASSSSGLAKVSAVYLEYIWSVFRIELSSARLGSGELRTGALLNNYE